MWGDACKGQREGLPGLCPQVGEGRRGEGSLEWVQKINWFLSPCRLSLFVWHIHSFKKNLQSANSVPGSVLDEGWVIR